MYLFIYKFKQIVHARFIHKPLNPGEVKGTYVIVLPSASEQKSNLV